MTIIVNLMNVLHAI